MLQRIQSLFLLLAAACAGVTWFFPVREWHHGKPEVIFRTYGLYDHELREVADATLPVPYHILLSLIAAVLVVCIFLHGNRPRQARVVRGTWLMLLLVGALQFISCNSMDAYLAKSGGWSGYYGASLFLPFVAIAFAFLAERAIKKDEELVRSADRLR